MTRCKLFSKNIKLATNSEIAYRNAFFKVVQKEYKTKSITASNKNNDINFEAIKLTVEVY